ncbi:hypothetical protein ABZ383_23375 [Streptomyces sp. NPDC005900]|uniref:hypothetical protein n=1 Tax=unclassified Streptomyces TaxID=2593676 RepID=UPI0033CE4666
MSQPLGMGHWSHPLIGRKVIDHAHGDRVGIFRAFAPDVDEHPAGPVLLIPETPPVVWLAPEEGGREWTTSPDAIEAAR